jgi:sigma-B regulation protein RsbU (phosphoserine phosphatase)
MRSAEAVGGDYYDVLPSGSGCWIAVGDVSGHGLNAGLVMLMLQSALGALVVSMPEASPVDLLRSANRLLVENIRHRLAGDDHVTVALMRVSGDGYFILSGGHEPVVILRADTGGCDIVEASGPWMGINVESAEHLSAVTGVLHRGDIVVLHSDGIVEAGASRGNSFGLERLCAVVKRLHDRPAEAICEEILREAQAWTPGPAEDDMTVVVLRFVGLEPIS